MLPEIVCLICSFVHSELIRQFFRACKSRDEQTVRWLWKRRLLSLEDIRSRNNLGLAFACCNGHGSLAQFIWTLVAPVSQEDHMACFRDACFHAQLSVARWLWDRGLSLQKIRENRQPSIFATACLEGQEEIVRWLWSLGMTLEDVRQENNRALVWACQKGHESIAKFLVGLGLTLQDIRAGENDAFHSACGNGHEKIARWLFSLGLTLTDVRQQTLQGLGSACRNGHENIAHWLLDLGLTLDDIKVTGCWTFRQACDGRLHSVVVRMWNMGLKPADIHPYDVFVDLCKMGSFETCQWLWNRGVRGDLDYAFARSCLYGKNLAL